MSIDQFFLLAAVLVPLSIDTFILAAALGLAGLPRNQATRTSLILASFEALMPVLGFLISAGVGRLIGQFTGYVAAIVIALTGVVLLRPGNSNEEQEEQRLKLLARARGVAIIYLGIGISVDGLGVGLSLGLLDIPLVLVVIWLGVQAFAAALLGLRLGGRLSEGLRAGAEKFAGVVLVAVGLALIVLKLTGRLF